MSRKSGFTLVELLVVIAIIGILVAMLLPAVQTVREAARRTECSNKIRQVSLALQNFEASNEHFPPGWRSDSGWGWMAHALPFIDEGNTASEFELGKYLLDPVYRSSIKRGMDGLICPSSTNNSATYELAADPGDTTVEVGRTHYVGCIGSAVPFESMDDGQTCPSMSLLYTTGFVDGMFYKNSTTPLRDVTDGTSTTILLGERSGDLFDSQWSGILDGSSHTGWRVVAWTGEPPNNPLRADPLVIIDDEGNEEELEIHFHGFAQFNSMHLGGLTMFAMVDGSVRTIHDDINPVTFRAMGTLQGGEIRDF